MVSIEQAVEVTLQVLERVEVRGKDNRNALSLAVDNLEAIAAAIRESKNRRDESHDSDDQQG